MDIQSLQRFCALDAGRDSISSPFVVSIGNRKWTVATNGVVLVACNCKLDIPKQSKGDDFLKDAAVDYIVDALSSDRVIAIDELRTWAGAASFPASEQCPYCKGTSHCKCHRCSASDLRCQDCKGGKIDHTPEVRHGLIGSSIVDRNLVACALDGAADLHVRVGLRGPIDPIGFAGKTWIAAVMPMAEHTKCEGAPRFELEAK